MSKVGGTLYPHLVFYKKPQSDYIIVMIATWCESISHVGRNFSYRAGLGPTLTHWVLAVLLVVFTLDKLMELRGITSWQERPACHLVSAGSRGISAAHSWCSSSLWQGLHSCFTHWSHSISITGQHCSRAATSTSIGFSFTSMTIWLVGELVSWSFLGSNWLRHPQSHDDSHSRH